MCIRTGAYSITYLPIIDNNAIVGAGHQEDVTTIDPQPGPKQSKSLPSLPVLGMCILPIIPTAGAIIKDAALREQCVVETCGPYLW